MGGNGVTLKGIKKGGSGGGRISKKIFEKLENEKETNDINLKNGGNFHTENVKFWYGETTDKIPREIINKNYKHLESIAKKMKKVYNIDITTSKFTQQNHTNKLTYHSYSLEENVLASCIFREARIIYNTRYFKTTAENIIKETEANIKIGFHTKISKANYINSTITHEFGHHIFGSIISEKLQKYNIFDSNSTREEEEGKIIKEILKIQKKHFNIKNNYISGYGNNGGYAEWLAEVFNNLMCGDKKTLSPLAKSMEIWFINNKGVLK